MSEKELFDASNRGDIKLVQKILSKKGININYKSI